MKLRLMVMAASALALFIGGCIGTLVIANIAGWHWFDQAKPRPVKIALVPALSTPISPPVVTKVVEAPPGLIEASVKTAPATATPSPTYPAPATVMPTPTATATPTASPTPRSNSLATRLVIAKLGLDAPVWLAPVENGTWRVDHLGQAVGHLEGTAPPGSESNIALAGHVTLAEGGYGPFAGLGQLVSGDEITVYGGDRAFYYVVDSVWKVTRTAVEVTYPTTTGQITLITCTTWNSEEGRYIDRLIVKGHLIKK